MHERKIENKIRKLTQAQETALRYYRALRFKATKEEKRALRFKHDPRPIQALYEIGFLHVVDRTYGGLCVITDAGLDWLSAKDAKRNQTEAALAALQNRMLES